MKDRVSFAYVVAVEGSKVTLNLKDEHRGQFAAQRDSVANVTELGGLFGVDAGTRLLILRVQALSFAEPKEAHRAGVGGTGVEREPLRNILGITVGLVLRRNRSPMFVPDSLSSPPLGAEAYPLTNEELSAVLHSADSPGPRVHLGVAVRGGGTLSAGLTDLLGRHVAVLGSSGQGKSCLTAAVLQQILKFRSPRVIVFDINGEYSDALLEHVQGEGECQVTVLGGDNPDLRIPYYALGRHGLARLLLPSEKTQRPALNFALDHLHQVISYDGRAGVGLAGQDDPVLFDDCRPNDVASAHDALETLRGGGAEMAGSWPPMLALACLVAESHAIRPFTRAGVNGVERSAFEYGNVSPLITRIRRCIEDPLFRSVVNVEGGPPCQGDALDWSTEGQRLVESMFGGPATRWKLHIVNLRAVAHDLMPLVLGSLLELLAFEMFKRGQGNTYPTLLVLEEAHHYLRQLRDDEDTGRHSLAYERLAKEGRKFGVSIWLSTQRPAEVSPTVLGQCGTWCVFRLTGDADLKAVAAASEWVDKQELARIAGLPRQQAIIFGTSTPVPTRVIAPTARPVPRSQDPRFDVWIEEMAAEAVGEAEEEAPVPPEDDIPF